MLGVELSTDSVNGEKFYDFVPGTLISEMLPFDGTSPRSIAIMDNCSIHHMQDVSDLFTDAGILQIFLPPYSPDMNPIEMAFGYVKGYLKKHEDIMHLIYRQHPSSKVHLIASQLKCVMDGSNIQITD